MREGFAAPAACGVPAVPLGMARAQPSVASACPALDASPLTRRRSTARPAALSDPSSQLARA
eukprot:4214798-Alexandrium_andersonii.AAC.1